MANELNTDIRGQKTSPAEEREHEIPLMAKRITEIPSNLQNRFEYNGDGTVLYAGYGARGLATSVTGWLIRKYTYSGGNVTVVQTAYDSWDNRVSATYS